MDGTGVDISRMVHEYLLLLPSRRVGDPQAPLRSSTPVTTATHGTRETTEQQSRTASRILYQQAAFQYKQGTCTCRYETHAGVTPYVHGTCLHPCSAKRRRNARLTDFSTPYDATSCAASMQQATKFLDPRHSRSKAHQEAIHFVAQALSSPSNVP